MWRKNVNRLGSRVPLVYVQQSLIDTHNDTNVLLTLFRVGPSGLGADLEIVFEVPLSELHSILEILLLCRL